MRTKVQKWGASLAIRIPKKIAEQLNISEGDELNIDIVNQQIRIDRRQPEYELDNLLVGTSKRNLHKIIDFGESVGNEVM